VERLKPLFLRWRKAFRQLMRNLALEYFRACETAGLEVDSDLLGEIVPQLSDENPPGADT